MLGKYVRVNVTNAINSQNEQYGYTYEQYLAEIGG